VLKRWYAGLAWHYHPDRGGTNEQMKVVNEAYDRLRQMVGVR
jgi:curved DNA-binding protein CbpA